MGTRSPVQERQPARSRAAPVQVTTGRAASERYAVAAAANVLRVLASFGELGSLSLSQAAEAAQVSPSTAYRLLVTMERMGFVERVGKRGYRIGPTSVRFAREVETQTDILTASRDIAHELGALTGESVRLALLSDGVLAMVYGLNGPDEVWADSRRDITINVHASAMGKAVAAYLDPTRLGPLLGDEPYRRLTTRTVTSWRQLQPRLDEVRSLGYALDLEECADGVVCVAVPIFRDDQIIGSISLEGGPPQLDEARVARLADLVKQAADKITNRLTHLRLRDGSAE